MSGSATSPAVALLVALALAGGALGSDFGVVRVKPRGGREAYGAVTFRPFAASRGAVLPMFVLVEAGDYSRPWMRAKRVAQLLPRAVERMLAGQQLKIGIDADRNPALFVGPAGAAGGRDDLELISALPADAQRFAREKDGRRVTPADLAGYWKLLLEDLVTVFVRFPLKRDPLLAESLHLTATRSGVILKRLLIEVGVLLRYEDLSVERASTPQIKAKTLEVLDAMTQEQWANLVDLGFRIPPDLEVESAAPPATPRVLAPPSPGPSGPMPLEQPDEPDEPSTTPKPPKLYVEPDRSVWPGARTRAPTEGALKNAGEKATSGNADEMERPELDTPVQAPNP